MNSQVPTTAHMQDPSNEEEGQVPWEDLTRFLDEPEFADAVVTCEDASWPVHKSIVSNRCRWFATAFDRSLNEANSNEVDIDGMEKEEVGLLIRYIYAGHLDWLYTADTLQFGTTAETWARCISLFKIGDFFELPALSDGACYFLWMRTCFKAAKTQRGTFMQRERQGTITSIPTQASADATRAIDAFFVILQEVFSYEDSSLDRLKEIFRCYIRWTACLATRDSQWVRAVAKIPPLAADLIGSMLPMELDGARVCRAVGVGCPLHHPINCIDCLDRVLDGPAEWDGKPGNFFAEAWLAENPENERVFAAQGRCFHCWEQRRRDSIFKRGRYPPGQMFDSASSKSAY